MTHFEDTFWGHFLGQNLGRSFPTSNGLQLPQFLRTFIYRIWMTILGYILGILFQGDTYARNISGDTF